MTRTGGAPGAARRPGRRLWILGLVALVTLAAAAGGFLAGHATGTRAAAPARHLSGAMLNLTLPDGWRQRASQDVPALGLTGALAAGPVKQPTAGLVIGLTSTSSTTLLPATLLATLPGTLRAQIVNLGSLVAYRYPDLTPRGGDAVESIYALPTSAGTVIAACSSPTASSSFAAGCEQALATLQLTSARELPLALGNDYAQALDQVIKQLNGTAAPIAEQLQSDSRAHDQSLAARQLAAADRQAAASVAQLAAGSSQSASELHSDPAAAGANAALATALRDRAAAYDALAIAAARDDPHAYSAASSALAAAARDLSAAFADLSALGYHVG